MSVAPANLPSPMWPRWLRWARRPAASRNGASIGLDTTNAAGGVFTLTSPIKNTNGGANVVGLTKNGVGTLQLSSGSGANANSYTSPTVVNKGTLKLTAANSLTGNTAVIDWNDATAKFDMNGFNVLHRRFERRRRRRRHRRDGHGNLNLNAASGAASRRFLPAPEQSTSIWASLGRTPPRKRSPGRGIQAAP